VLSDTHSDIARFEVTVNKIARMDVLQVMELGIADISLRVVVSEVKFTYQLPSQKQYSLDCELKMALSHIIQQYVDSIYMKSHVQFYLCLHESPHGPTK